MTEDDIVTLEGMPLLRAWVWRSLLFTNLRLIGLGPAGGAIMATAAYFDWLVASLRDAGLPK